MEERDDLGDLEDPVAGLLGALFVRRLRLRHGDGHLDRVAELTGLSVRTLQRYEKGQAVPPPKTLAFLAQKAGFSRRLLDRLQKTLQADRLTEAGRLGGGPGSPRLEVAAAALEAVEEMAELLAVEPAPAPWEDTGKPRAEDRLRADELWRRFLGRDRDQRYRLVRDRLLSTSGASPSASLTKVKPRRPILRRMRWSWPDSLWKSPGTSRAPRAGVPVSRPMYCRFSGTRSVYATSSIQRERPSSKPGSFRPPFLQAILCYWTRAFSRISKPRCAARKGAFLRP